MDFDLRQLRHARALAEQGSFARAARTLHLTQPALSRSIQELERRTGLKLFDRAQGRVEPTDLGRTFLAHARELLGRAEALERETATLRGTGTGALIVGSGTFPTAMFVAEGVSAFLRRNPGVGIRLVNDNVMALVTALRRRELDLVVAAQPAIEEAADLAVRPVARRQGMFLVRAGHPLLARPALALADLGRHPIICTGRLTPPVADVLLEVRGTPHPARPLPDVACESVEMMLRIARTTDHVLLSTLAANAEAIDAGMLVPLPLVEPRLEVGFAVIRLQGRTLPPIADDLVDDLIAADRVTAEVERVRMATLQRDWARAAGSPPGSRGRVPVATAEAAPAPRAARRRAPAR